MASTAVRLIYAALATSTLMLNKAQHYSDVIMSVMASQIINLTIDYSGADQRKH